MSTAITILKIISEAVVLTDALRDLAIRAVAGEPITEEEMNEARNASQALVDEWNNKE
jgi:hypothetical protein